MTGGVETEGSSEASRKYHHEYYLANKERLLEKNREWRLANRASLLAQKREYNVRPEVAEKRHAAHKADRNRRNLQALERRKKTPWRHLLYAAYQRAKKKGLEYALSPEWAMSRYTGFCELTGIEFRYGKGGLWPYSPSIDRIEQSRGYTPDNCRFILMGINNMRGISTDKEMFFIAKRLAEVAP